MARQRTPAQHRQVPWDEPLERGSLLDTLLPVALGAGCGFLAGVLFTAAVIF